MRTGDGQRLPESGLVAGADGGETRIARVQTEGVEKPLKSMGNKERSQMPIPLNYHHYSAYRRRGVAEVAQDVPK